MCLIREEKKDDILSYLLSVGVSLVELPPRSCCLWQGYLLSPLQTWTLLMMRWREEETEVAVDERGHHNHLENPKCKNVHNNNNNNLLYQSASFLNNRVIIYVGIHDVHRSH